MLLTLYAGAEALSIYNIQYTTSRGVDNSYPSPYSGKEVSLEGVVTATNYQGGGFFLSELISGAWRGIFVYDNTYKPSVGSYLRITGEVAELFGMTCIQDLSSFRILDRNRPRPNPAIISTGQLSNSLEAEAYEGVYSRVINASTSSSKTKSNRFMINDGSGQCSIALGNFGHKASSAPSVGVQYSQVAGVVVFNYGEYSLNPISSADMQVQQPVSVQNRSWGKIKSIYK